MVLGKKTEFEGTVVQDSLIKRVLTSDITHIMLVYVIGLALTATWYYYKDLVILFFPILIESDYIGMIQVFIVIVFLGFVFQTEYLYFMYFSFIIFQSLMIIVILIAVFVVVTYYIAYVIMEKISLHVERTGFQKISKFVCLWFGIGAGIYLVAITFPTSNLFNFNYMTWVLFDIKSYIRNIFELIFTITSSGLIVGYTLVFISDLVFMGYRRVTKKRLVKVVVGHTWTDETEVKIEQGVKKIFKIKPTPKRSKLSNIGRFGVIVTILFIAFFVFKLSVSRTTTVRVKFSDNFMVYGDSHELTSGVNIYHIGIMSSSMTPDKVLMMFGSGWAPESYFADLPFELLGQSKYMFLMNWFVGGLEFVFDMPKDHSVYFIVVSFMYKRNITEDWCQGRCIMFTYFPSSIIPRVVTIHGLYLTDYYPSQVPPLVFGYALSSVQDGWLYLYDYLYRW